MRPARPPRPHHPPAVAGHPNPPPSDLPVCGGRVPESTQTTPQAGATSSTEENGMRPTAFNMIAFALAFAIFMVGVIAIANALLK